MFAGDRDRDRAAATLREHFVHGRLTLDELTDRTGRALSARSHEELRSALAGLPGSALVGVPVLEEARELAARGRPVALAALRGAVLVVFTGAYLLFSLVLVLVLSLTLLIHGASASALLGFLVVWLVPTYLLARLWHRTPPRRRPGT